MNATRIATASSCALLCIAVVRTASAALVLNGACVVGSTDDQQSLNGQGWITRADDGIYDLFIREPGGDWYNDVNRRPSITLKPGIHVFELAADSGGFGELPWPGAVFALTFNTQDDNTTPQVAALTTYTTDLSQPSPLLPWTGSVYTNAGSIVPGPATSAWFDLSTGYSVVIAEIRWMPMWAQPSSDLVGPTSAGPNGQADYRGWMTLNVVPATAPAALLLAAAPALLRRRRPCRRSA